MVAITAAAVALAATAAMAPPPVLRLAGFFPMRGAWPGGVSVRPAVEAAIADVNNDTTLLNETELQLVAHDSACDGPTALTEGLAYQPTMNSSSYEAPIVGILGPGCSPACEDMSILANVWRYPTVSFSCTSPTLSNTAAYPYFLRLAIPDFTIANVWLALVREFGWQRVGLINQVGALFESTIAAFTQYLEAAGVQYVQATETLRADATPNDAARAVASLAAGGVRIVFFACYEDVARSLFRALHAAGMYGQQYAFLTLGWLTEGWWAESAGGDENVTEVAKYHFAAQKTTCGVTPTASCAAFRSRFASPDAYTHYGYDAVWAWARALDAAIRRGDERALLGGGRGGFADPDKSDLWWHLRNLTFEGVSGTVAFASNGDRAADTVTLDVGNMQPDGSGGWTMRPVAIFDGVSLNFTCASCGPHYFAGRRTEPPRAVPPALGLLMRVTGDDGQALDASWQAVTCAALLAVQHVNAGDGRVISDLATFQGSGFELRPILGDTRSSTRDALQAYYSSLSGGAHAVVGPAMSRSSRAVGLFGDATTRSKLRTLGQSRGVPQLSYWSSDSSLSDNTTYPFFARSIYSNRQTATHLASSLTQPFDRLTHIGIVFVDDEYGQDLANQLFDACQANNIDVRTKAAFSPSTPDETIRSAVGIATGITGLRVFVSICFGTHIIRVLRAAQDNNALRSGYAWIWVDGSQMLPANPSQADAELLYGLLTFEWRSSESSLQKLDSVWSTFTPDDCSGASSLFTPTAALFASRPKEVAHIVYDSVVAMAMALYRVNDPRAGDSVLSELGNVRFEGASGPVAFDANHDRIMDASSFQFSNLVRSGKTASLVEVVRVPSSGEGIVWIGGGSEAPIGCLIDGCEAPFGSSLWYSTVAQNAIGPIIGGLVVLLLVLLIARRRHKLHRQRDHLLLRWQKTGLPPVLPRLASEQHYHLFLSHTWKSGQDQVAVIKRQLSAMLPGVKIFLDVDDLDDLAKLEEHIKRSTLVLCFLSRGYFLSAPCMIEMRAAILHGKPIVAVHEEDDQHGGAPLTEIFDDCPKYIKQSDVFSVGQNGCPRLGDEPPIPWLRSKPMQRASLALIAEALMKTFAKRASRWGVPSSPLSEPTAGRRSSRFSTTIEAQRSEVSLVLPGQKPNEEESTAGVAGSPRVSFPAVPSTPNAKRPLNDRLTYSGAGKGSFFPVFQPHVLRKPYPVLYASPNNPGALKVAEMLSDCAVGLRVESEAPSMMSEKAEMEMVSPSRHATPASRRSEPEVGETNMPRKRRKSGGAVTGHGEFHVHIPSLHDAKEKFRDALATIGVGESVESNPEKRSDTGVFQPEVRRSILARLPSKANMLEPGAGEEGLRRWSAPSVLTTNPEQLGGLKDATHMLVYLNKETFVGAAGERLANELRLIRSSQALHNRVTLLLVHETRPEHGGCDFDRFFHVTPVDIVRPPGDLYASTIAIPLHAHERHIAVALSQLAKALGAKAKLSSQNPTPFDVASGYASGEFGKEASIGASLDATATMVQAAWRGRFARKKLQKAPPTPARRDSKEGERRSVFSRWASWRGNEAEGRI